MPTAGWVKVKPPAAAPAGILTGVEVEVALTAVLEEPGAGVGDDMAK